MAAFDPTMSLPPLATDPVRPSMRRKSSAQNLLSSFKTNSSQSAQVATVPSATGLQYTSTPTPTTMSREWDVQSLHSESVGSSAGGTSLATNGSTLQSTSIEILRELVKKRIITLTYIRSVHEGRSHWFHTIMVTRPELDRVFTNNSMKTRTYRYAILGMALANLFDVKDPQDLLRGLSAALNEYDSSKDDSEKPRIRLFRTRGAKRQMGGTDFAMTYTDASDASFVTMPHVPFPLDYHQTLLSLLDVLSEVYNKISKILGPSPFPGTGSGGAHMMGPLGLLSPHPGVSYLFSGTETTPFDGDGSLWSIANAQGPSGAVVYGGALGSPPPNWNSGLGDTVKAIDTKLKKLIATLLKELDDCARAGIKDELASLDPLLRHVSVAEDLREAVDFEP